jgi:O-antigen ligase
MICFAICLSEFLKRFIYINGPVPIALYYGCIFIPTLIAFIYILLGDRKLDRHKSVIFFVFVIIQILIVLLGNREKFGRLIIFLCSNTIYIFPLFLKNPYKINNNQCNYLFLLLLTITLLYGLIQHFIGYFAWDKNWSDFSSSVMDIYAIGNFGSFNRAYSLFSGIQDFAVFLIFTTLLLLNYIKSNVLQILIIFCLITGLYIAGSKSMIISLFISLIIYLVRQKINPLILFIMLFILPYIIIMSIYTAYQNDIVSMLINMTGLFNFGTILPRLEIFYNFFSSFEIGNLLGCGSGCMVGVVDNMYIRILIENGLIGFVAFMLLLYTIIKRLLYITNVQHISQSGKENVFLFLSFMTISISMYSGELLHSRFSIIIYIYIIICINNKYVKLKQSHAFY